MSELDFTLTPVEKPAPAQYKPRSKWDPVLNAFLELDDRWSIVTVVGYESKTIKNQLRSRIIVRDLTKVLGAYLSDEGDAVIERIEKCLHAIEEAVKLEFYIVGSALTEKEPRDVDMYGVMEDSTFRSNFGMTAREFEEQRSSGRLWGPELTKWKEETIGALRALQYVFPQLVPLDFKYIPESLFYEAEAEPSRRIDITTRPETWGIGFPRLENHDDALLVEVEG